jgi:hypothetical protein
LQNRASTSFSPWHDAHVTTAAVAAGAAGGGGATITG